MRYEGIVCEVTECRFSRAQTVRDLTGECNGILALLGEEFSGELRVFAAQRARLLALTLMRTTCLPLAASPLASSFSLKGWECYRKAIFSVGTRFLSPLPALSSSL
jgi:hypothetical protein